MHFGVTRLRRAQCREIRQHVLEYKAFLAESFGRYPKTTVTVLVYGFVIHLSWAAKKMSLAALGE